MTAARRQHESEADREISGGLSRRSHRHRVSGAEMRCAHHPGCHAQKMWWSQSRSRACRLHVLTVAWFVQEGTRRCRVTRCSGPSPRVRLQAGEGERAHVHMTDAMATAITAQVAAPRTLSCRQLDAFSLTSWIQTDWAEWSSPQFRRKSDNHCGVPLEFGGNRPVGTWIGMALSAPGIL